MKLRPATPADKDFLRSLHHRAYRDVVIRQFGAWDEAEQDEWFERDLAGAIFMIVELAGRPVGAIAVDEQPNAIALVELQILPEFQRQGLGTALLAEKLDFARRHRKPIRLQVLHQNRALAFYKRNGFSVTASTATHYLMEWNP